MLGSEVGGVAAWTLKGHFALSHVLYRDVYEKLENDIRVDNATAYFYHARWINRAG